MKPKTSFRLVSQKPKSVIYSLRLYDNLMNMIFYFICNNILKVLY